MLEGPSITMLDSLLKEDKMEARVKFSLQSLVQATQTSFDISEVDDIVVGYIFSVLEDLEDQECVEEFDYEGLQEKLFAYLP